MVIVSTSGCGFVLPDRIHYQWQPGAHPALSGVPSQAGGDALVGLALSGGGSRAALFAAAVLEQLADAGLTDRITHISSVSGGGFAASYFVTHPLAAACPGGDAACRRRYFATFLDTMREDFWGDMLLNQLAHPDRITSPTRRATSLQEALDDSFLHGVTFADLPASPVLLLNAASYDDARRFVFANLVLDEGPPDLAPLARDALLASSFSLPDCPRPTPPDIPVSLAVVASAAFPPVFGPITVEAPRSCTDATPQYWHLGDGGLLDNTGADTLYELVMRRVHGEGGLQRALVLVADAGAPMDPDGSRGTADLSIFTSNPGAVVTVAQARGNAFAELFWQQQRETIGIPFDTIVFRFDAAELADWPASCTSEREADLSILVHLGAVPTALEIGDCDADLMIAAARDLVRRRLDEAADILARHGLAAAWP